MKHLEALNKFFNNVLMVLGAIAVLGLMVLATGNVVLRILHIPFRGTYEIVSFLGACVIAFTSSSSSAFSSTSNSVVRRVRSGRSG